MVTAAIGAIATVVKAQKGGLKLYGNAGVGVGSFVAGASVVEAAGLLLLGRTAGELFFLFAAATLAFYVLGNLYALITCQGGG